MIYDGCTISIYKILNRRKIYGVVVLIDVEYGMLDISLFWWSSTGWTANRASQVYNGQEGKVMLTCYQFRQLNALSTAVSK